MSSMHSSTSPSPKPNKLSTRYYKSKKQNDEAIVNSPRKQFQAEPTEIIDLVSTDEEVDEPSSEISQFLSGNLPESGHRERGCRRMAFRDSDVSSFTRDLGADCREWQLLESTHLCHLPEQDEPDLTEDLGDASIMTQDLTKYHTVLEEHGKDEVQTDSSGTFRTAPEPIMEDPKTPAAKNPPATPSMKGSVLFSIGKRKSLVPLRSNQRPILAADSSEEEEEEDDFVPLWRSRRKARKASDGKGLRRSILGKNPVMLLPSDSDEDEAREQNVKSWIVTSPFSSPRTELRNLSDFAQDSSLGSLRLSNDTSEFSSEQTSHQSDHPQQMSNGGSNPLTSTATSNIESNSREMSTDNRRKDISVQVSLDSSDESLGDPSILKTPKRNAALQVSIDSTDSEHNDTLDGTDDDDALNSRSDDHVSVHVTSPMSSRAHKDKLAESPESKLQQDISYYVSSPQSSRKVRSISISDDDEDLTTFFSNLRAQREKRLEVQDDRRKLSLTKFIVNTSDESDSSKDESLENVQQDKNFIGKKKLQWEDKENDTSKYRERKVSDASSDAEDVTDESDVGGKSSSDDSLINTKVKAVIILSDDSSDDEEPFKIKRQMTTSDESSENEELPDISPPVRVLPKKRPPITNTPAPISRKPFQPKDFNKPESLPPLTFLQSLSLEHPNNRCHPYAAKYITHFSKTKVDLCEKLYRLFNEEIFISSLDPNAIIEWAPRLTKTAGLCCQQTRRKGSEKIRYFTIRLSTKVIDSADRLRDTLIHEMCHAASWVISGYYDGHGAIWKDWARRCKVRFPELPVIARCHNYAIRSKYSYVCQKCGHRVNRHSKSMDTARWRCGRCQGHFELYVNKISGVSAQTPGRRVEVGTPKAPNAFALFVKENYKVVRTPGVHHKDAMQELGKRFAEAKLNG